MNLELRVFSERSRLLAPLTLAVLLAAFASAIGPRSAYALGPICRVAAGAGGTTGATWATAFGSLDSALETAGCTEVWVKAGVYTPGTLQTDAFDIRPGVKVYGGFVGTETGRAQRNPALNVTILSGDIDDNDTTHLTTHINVSTGDIVGNNSYHVVEFDGDHVSVPSSTVLDGFVITGGDGGLNSGGGVHCEAIGSTGSCNPTLANLTFSGNRASYGGAISFSASTGGTVLAAIKNVTFRGNLSSVGGAMYIAGGHQGVSKPTITNSTFYSNYAIVNGGAVVNETYDQGISSPTFKNVTFYGNAAEAAGGALYNITDTGSANPTLTNTILWDNLSPSGSQILNVSATPKISHSDIKGSGGSAAWDTGLGTNMGWNIDASPLFNVFGPHGGSTATLTLQLGSPAIDTGTNTGCPATDQRGVPRPLKGDAVGPAICDMGATESRYGSKTIRSAGKYDGWVLQESEGSLLGGTRNATSTTTRLGDDSQDRQYDTILSFATSALPDAAEIQSVRLRIKKAGLTGTDPFANLGTLQTDIRNGTFGSKALEAGDYQAAPDVGSVSVLGSTPAAGWYSGYVESAWLGYFNPMGTTQLRLRFANTDNDNMHADYLSFYSGNATTVGYRPQLIITYYAP